MRVKVSEGDVFVVPTPKGQVVGVLARKGSSKILFGYFFAPLPSPRSVQQIDALTRTDAVLVGLFSGLRLESGDWPVIGRRTDWESERWDLPEFVFREGSGTRIFLVKYDENDLATIRSRRQVTESELPGNLPDEGLMGAVYVEERLARLI